MEIHQRNIFQGGGEVCYSTTYLRYVLYLGETDKVSGSSFFYKRFELYGCMNSEWEDERSDFQVKISGGK